jgi:hypothetical protein
MRERTVYRADLSSPALQRRPAEADSVISVAYRCEHYR